MLLFSSFVETEMRYLLGYLMIYLVFVYVFYNTLVIIYYSLNIMLLHLRRVFI